MSLKRSFFDSMKILYLFGKCVGISSYSVTKENQKYKVGLKPFDFVQIIVFTAIYSILLYCNYIVELNIIVNVEEGNLFNTGQRILIIIGLSCLLGGSIKIVFMRDKYWQIVAALDVIDNDMKRLLNIQINYNKLYQHSVAYLYVFHSALFITYFTYSIYFFVVLDGLVIHYVISYVITNTSLVLVTNQLQIFMYSTYMRFSMLNEFIGSKIGVPVARQQLISSEVAMELRKHIFSVAIINEKLNDIIPSINSYFSIFIIPAFAGVFCITVFNLNNFYRILCGLEMQGYDFFFLMSVYEMLSVIFNFMIAFCIIASTYNTNAAKKMGVLVHKIISRTNDHHLILKLKILSQQILHRSPNFSFGLFSLDWSFAYTHAATVAAYLMILIQFENYAPRSSDNSE